VLDELKRQKHAIISRYMKASNGAGFWQAANTLAPLALLWWAAVWSIDYSWWLTAALILLMSLFSLRVLVLLHECGHGSLFRTQMLNRAFGFAFGVVTGMPQYVWSQHHAFHHATNGDWEKYRGPLTTPSTGEYSAFNAKQQRIFKVTRSLPMAPLAGFVYLLFNPRFNWMRGSLAMLAHAARCKWQQPSISFKNHIASYSTRLWNNSKEYRHMSWNNVVLLGWCALMIWWIGTGPFFLIHLISISLAGAGGIILFTVQHNFEHAYATDSRRWDHDVGAIHGTSFLQFPAWLNWFTANIAFHHVHHLSARIPNYRLAECHKANAALFTDVKRVKLSEIHKALKCIIWDTDAERIISMAEYERLPLRSSSAGFAAR
jgi:omega-6 fatty acid desaturase (delta-12 desaturase)